MDSSYNSSSTKPLYLGTQIIWYLLGLLETLLVFRFVLKFLDANSAAGFSRFIYTITYPFANLFFNVFQTTVIQDSVFEWTTLLAMLAYALIAQGIVKIFFMSKTISMPEAAAKLSEEEK